MDTTALTVIGQQLTDFLMKQFTPPPGTSTRLGFLGSAVAVDPDSFMNAGVFNPALVNSWLDIVMDPLGSLADNGSQVESAPWTATQLMETVCTQALSTAPANSDAKQSFDRARDQASEDLGGATTIGTAPLDWYNPAQLANWPTCSLSATSSSGQTSSAGSGSGTNGTATPVGGSTRPIWAWRRLNPTPIVMRDRPIRVGASFDQFRRTPAAFSAMATPFVAAQAMRQPVLVAETGAAAATTPNIALRRQTERTIVAAQALTVSQAISSEADNASTSSVQSTSLSLSLKYLVVQLSRASWWNEFLLTSNSWYIPNYCAGSILNGGESGRTPGLPIALILTSDVAIQSNWSQADRSAMANNTHFGPWALSSAQSSFATDATIATLSFGGIQAIAAIYRDLPSLPPASDPNLPPA